MNLKNDTNNQLRICEKKNSPTVATQKISWCYIYPRMHGHWCPHTMWRCDRVNCKVARENFSIETFSNQPEITVYLCFSSVFNINLMISEISFEIEQTCKNFFFHSEPTKPREFQVSHNSHTRKLNLTWSEPFPANGIIIEYLICYTALFQSIISHKCLKTSDTKKLSYVIGDLRKFYNICLIRFCK